MTDDPARGKRVLLGEISSVHGIRGEIVVRSYTADPGDIAKYGALETVQGLCLPKLSLVRVTDRGVIARLDGVTDRTKAETYRGTQLWIARDRLPVAEPGEYYHADLVGLDAVAPDGKPIGHVISVDNFGAGDLLEIRLANSKQTEYVPFTNTFVPAVDLTAGTVTVVLPEAAEGEEPDDPGGDESPQDDHQLE